MPALVTTFNYGKSLINENPELARQLSDSYTVTALAVNTKISKYTTDGINKPHANPPASSTFNINFEIGDIYVRTDTNSAWILSSRTTSSAVTWALIT